jgi:hypothetical protein
MASGERSVSPRVVGSALIVVCAAAGFGTAALIANPTWGIPAAIGLAGASVGVLWGLLTAIRTGWDDKTWPPTGARRDSPRSRRWLTGYGVFLLAVAASAATGLIVSDADDPSRGVGVVGLVIALMVVGGSFVGLGLVRTPAPVVSTTRPDDDSAARAAPWVRLGPEGFVASMQPVGAYSYATGGGALFAAWGVLLPLGTAGVIFAVSLTAVGVVATVAFRRRQGRPWWAARDGSAIRRGAKEARADEITSAFLVCAPWDEAASRRSLAITLETAQGFRATVALRSLGKLVLTADETFVLAELVSRSAIRLPRDAHDPRGRFSKALYPSHVSHAEALAVVRDPPGDGETLPIILRPPNV